MGGGGAFLTFEIGSRHLFGEGYLLERGRLVEEIRCSLFVTFIVSRHHLILSI